MFKLYIFAENFIFFTQIKGTFYWYFTSLFPLFFVLTPQNHPPMDKYRIFAGNIGLWTHCIPTFLGKCRLSPSSAWYSSLIPMSYGFRGTWHGWTSAKNPDSGYSSPFACYISTLCSIFNWDTTSGKSATFHLRHVSDETSFTRWRGAPHLSGYPTVCRCWAFRPDT